MTTLYTTIETMTEDIKAQRDTTETLLGRPVIALATFTKDFKDIVRRLIDPSKTQTRNWNTEDKETGHPPSRVREDYVWKETGWVKAREVVMVSVAGRVKGMRTYYTKRIDGWENNKGDWVSTEEMGDWTNDKKAREFKYYNPKTEQKWVTDYLPDDDELRIRLFNLFSAPETSDHYAEFAPCSRIDPFDNNCP